MIYKVRKSSNKVSEETVFVNANSEEEAINIATHDEDLNWTDKESSYVVHYTIIDTQI